MKSNRIKAALAVAVIAISTVVLWRQLSKPAVNFGPSHALGEVVAGEIARLSVRPGKVILIGRSAARDGKDARAEQLASLEAALRHRSPAQAPATEWLPRLPAGVMDLGAIAPEQLSGLIDKHKDVNSFVVFAGLPPLTDDLAAKVVARSLKLLAVCGYGPNVRRWLEARALSLAVVPRSDDLPTGTPAPRSAIDLFQREFQILTPENVGRLTY